MTAFALFALVLLTALALASSSKAAVESPAPPQVWSDKADYAPGETVTLSGANWALGESVHIRVNDDAGQTWSRDVDVTAADDGTISDQFALPTSFVAIYAVTATGPQSGTATWTFTDGNVKARTNATGFTFRLDWTRHNGTKPQPQGTCNAPAAQQASGVAPTVGFSGGGPTGQFSDGVPSDSSEVLQAADVASNGFVFIGWTGETSSDTFIDPPPPLAADDHYICVPGDFTGTRTYVANYEANAAPTVARNNATVTVNEGQTAPNNGTFGDSNALDTVTLTASVGSITQVGTHSGTWSWSYATTDGPDQGQPVTITATDNHGATSTTTFTLVVNNLPPTGTLGNNGPKDEGSAVSVSFTGVSDPSSVDATSLHYAFDCAGGSLAAVTYAGAGTSPSASCTFDDNGSYSVTGVIIDKDGGRFDASTTVMVNNVAPTADFTNTGPADEGTSFTLSMDNGDDVSSVDKAAKFTFAFDCGDGSGYGAFTSTATLSASTSCSTDDNGTHAVKARIRDKDGGVREYTASVTVNNVAPTADFTNTGPVDEGSSFTLSMANGDDVSSADKAAEFTFALDCGDGSGYGAFTSTATLSASATCATNDNGTRAVKAKIRDKDGGVREYTASVTVTNVAPTVTLSGPLTANEGDTEDYSYSWTDPGSADTFPAAGNSVSCGVNGAASAEVFDTSSNSGSFKCTWSDDSGAGMAAVSATVTDDDGGAGTDTRQVKVSNVAPTVAWTSLPNPVNEDKNGTVTYTFSISDPGDDVSAYVSSYPKCGPNGSPQGSPTIGASSGSFQCRFSDGPAFSLVEVKVKDGDDDSNLLSENVEVKNVAPTVNLSGPNTADEGTTKTYTFTLSDPGDDTFSFVSGPPTDYPTCGDYGQLLGTPTVAGGSFQCYFPDGPKTTDVAIKIQDDDGGVSAPDVEQVDIISVTIANVPPTVTAPADQNSDEGESKSFLLGSFTDPGADADWKVDVSWGDATVEPQFTLGSTGSIPAQAHAYNDNGTYTVTVKVTDKDGEFDSKTFEVSVANVPPTGTLGNNGPINEGSSATVDFSGVSDPSSVDNGTLHDAFDCAGGSLDAVTYAAAGTFSSTSCTYDDGDSDHTVTGVIIDKDGGRHDASTVVQVNNVAPSATFSHNGPVDEGSSFTLSLTSASDPSNADTAAGFQYKFDCGDGSGYGAYGSSNSATCPTDDSGTRDVKGKVRDKDSGEREYTASVTVNNVAPSATFSHNGPVDEGSSFTISLADPSDPSSVDTAAGFQYAFNCGSGYAAYGSATSRSCPTTDNGVRAVKGKIKDKDGGEHEYMASLSVNNVAPIITNVTASDTFAGPLVFMTSSISTYFTDPGSADTWTNLLNFSDGGTESGSSPTAQGGDDYKFTLTHSFATPGCKTVMSKVTDDDGGYDTFGPTPVNVGTGQFLPPVTNTPVTNKLKNGQVLPVKVKLTDCSGAPITNLSPAIVLKKGDMTVFNDDSVVAITPGSVSGADTTGVMRSSGDGSYIYNMSVNITLNTDYTILIYPYGTGTPTQYLAHVIQATK